MKHTLGLIASSALFILISGCEPEKPKDSVVIRPVNSVNELFGRPAQTTTTPASSGSGTTNTTNQPVSTSSSTATGLNPAHGQPGHRCEIPVGAPLNSASQAKTISTNPAGTPVQPTFTPTPTPVTSGAGLNPAHGQPGHDCSIAVGAPLKK